MAKTREKVRFKREKKMKPDELCFSHFWRKAIGFALLWGLLFPSYGQAGAEDPFAPSGVMPSGPYAGRKLETNTKRSFRIISPEEAKLRIPAEVVERAKSIKGTRFIANIGHFKKFWVGIFPPGSEIESIYFEMERFPPKWLAAHTELRINLKPGSEVILYPQEHAEYAPVKISNFVLSVEGVPMVDGPRFDMIQTMQDKFGLAKRLISVDERIRWSIIHEKHTVEEFALDLLPEQKEALWEIALKDLHDPEMTGIYHLLKKNCTNSMFELLDHFIKRERGVGPRMMTTVLVWSERALKIRKLLLETKKLKTLNEEFSGEIQRIKECNLILNGNAAQERMGKL